MLDKKTCRQIQFIENRTELIELLVKAKIKFVQVHDGVEGCPDGQALVEALNEHVLKELVNVRDSLHYYATGRDRR